MVHVVLSTCDLRPGDRSALGETLGDAFRMRCTLGVQPVEAKAQNDQKNNETSKASIIFQLFPPTFRLFEPISAATIGSARWSQGPQKCVAMGGGERASRSACACQASLEARTSASMSRVARNSASASARRGFEFWWRGR